VINKSQAGPANVSITLANFSSKSAQRWQLTSSNAIAQLSDTALSGNKLSAAVPAQSITMFVLPSMSR
jgi:O-glycosyl hydrolase